MCVSVCMTENKTPLLLEEIQSRFKHIFNECETLYNNMSGEAMDIGSGTLIKIRTDAGYVTLSSPSNNTPGALTIWYKREILTPEQVIQRANSY
jgi:hypothetical protein